MKGADAAAGEYILLPLSGAAVLPLRREAFGGVSLCYVLPSHSLWEMLGST